MNNELKWGISKLQFQDKEFGQLDLNAFGLFLYEITNKELFESMYLNEKLKNNLLDYDEYARQILLNIIKNYISSKIWDFQKELQIINTNEFIIFANNLVVNYGLIFRNITIQSIVLTEESNLKVSQMEQNKMTQFYSNQNVQVSNNDQNKVSIEVVDSINTNNTILNNIGGNNSNGSKKLISIIITSLIIAIALIFVIFGKLTNDKNLNNINNNEVKIIDEKYILNSSFELKKTYDGRFEIDENMVVNSNSADYFLFEFVEEYSAEILVEGLDTIDLYIVGLKDNERSILSSNKNLNKSYNINFDIYKSYEKVYVVVVNNNENNKNYKLIINKKEQSLAQTFNCGINEIKFIDKTYGELYFNVQASLSYEIVDNKLFQEQYSILNVDNKYQTTNNYVKSFIEEAYNKYIDTRNINSYNNLNFIMGNDLIGIANANVENYGFRFTKINIMSVELTQESLDKTMNN